MIELANINVIFKQGKKEIVAVDNVSLTINQEEINGIDGDYGAGKSTLVRVINLLQEPTKGTVKIKETSLTELSPKQLRKERKDRAKR